MIFIPIGILLYLAIKYGSDLNMVNKGLAISSTGYDYLAFGLDKRDLSNLLSGAQKINNDFFIIENMPIRLSELGLCILGFKDVAGIPSNHLNYLGGLASFYGLGESWNGMLCINNIEDKRNMFAARMIYDEFIKHGLFEIDKSDGAISFIKRNCVILCNEIHSEFLFSDIPVVNIVDLKGLQDKIFGSKKFIFAKYNALLMLYLQNGHIKVMNC
jgi:hypothetical protein